MTSTGGSQQQRQYRIARRDGATMATACVLSGISMGEARLIEAEDLKDPPPPEAFILLNPAPTEAPTPKEEDMASRKPRETPISGEVPKPDFEMADRIIREDIAPANKEQKRAMKEASDGWKMVKTDARVHVGGARTAFKVAEMEEAEQQAWLRSFAGMLKRRNVTLHPDLADQAEGNTQVDIVPVGERPRPQLATVPKTPPPADDADLSGEHQQAAE